MSERSLQDAVIRAEKDRLILSNACGAQEWRIGAEYSTLLRLQTPADDWLPPAPSGDCSAAAAVRVEIDTRPLLPGAATAVIARVFRANEEETAAEEFAVLPGLGAFWHRARPHAVPAAFSAPPAAVAGGIETDPPHPRAPQPSNDSATGVFFALPLRNRLLHILDLFDQTDGRDNLLHWRSYRLSGVERPVAAGCLFALEDPLTRRGLVFLKNAPLPHARPASSEGADLVVEENGLRLCADGAGNPYPLTVLPFAGGRAGITQALQAYRRALHPYRPGRDGCALSNTWGDRNRDGALSESFLKDELRAAARLGVEVCQIDDGWQRGVSANSVIAKQAGGVWEGFYAADPDFWTHHPQRLPNGLAPLAAEAQAQRVGLGLWFAPDSAHDFANWRRDADNLLRLYREFGVQWIKIDGVKSRTPLAERNLAAFFHAVLTESNHDVLFDLDVTAEIRPGYFGLPEAGTLFVENRYTDWGRYWPHATFRNLWQLAHVLPPAGLRVEWLNPQRNPEQYGDDPLAPARVPVAYAFATLMVASPLLWCELCRIPEPTAGALAASIALWKQHRSELHTGTVYPIGEAPDGGSWSGFLVMGPHSWHLLAFRERTPEEHHWFALPPQTLALFDSSARPAAHRPGKDDAGHPQRIAGTGSMQYQDGMIRVSLPEMLEYGWWRGRY